MISLPKVRTKKIPWFIAFFVPEGFSITIYPYIFLSKSAYDNPSVTLIQHETYHASRQNVSWFWKYLTSKSFKLDEECRAYAWGFRFLAPSLSLQDEIAWAARELCSSRYGYCGRTIADTIEKIQMYYIEDPSKITPNKMRKNAKHS